mmetsp:Transcript_27430/g.47357  ORF Transcript_27430/g.47357 Transcript_27430/m.47357 type:complete len:80 (+) Transcript_27430:1924-2163(+)
MQLFSRFSFSFLFASLSPLSLPYPCVSRLFLSDILPLSSLLVVCLAFSPTSHFHCLNNTLLPRCLTIPFIERPVVRGQY